MNDMSTGFVGCGVAIEHQIKALKAVPNVRVVWFCDKDESRARNAVKLWGRETIIGDNFEKLLSEKKPDVVHVNTPPKTHTDLAIKVLEAGCHLLLEKPMATSIEDAKRILSVRDRTGMQLCMMHNHLFDPSIRSVQQLIKQGELGELIYAEGRHFVDIRKLEEEGLLDPNHWVHKLKSGTADEYMPHTIYVMQSFMGPCKELQLMRQSVASDIQNKYTKEIFAVQLRFDNALGRILIIDKTPYGHFGVDLYGTRAAAHINMMDLTYSIERIREFLPLPAARMGSTVEQSLQKLWQTFAHSVGIATGQFRRRPGHRGLIRAFYDALRNGDPVPVSGEEGLATIETLEMLDRAMAGIE